MDKENISANIEIDPKKLQIIAWLESLRWTDKKRAINNFETSFYCDDDLFKLDIKEDGSIENLTEEKAEAILLTHYLVYICDRQMDYRHIFKAGGYTISTIVKDYLRENDNDDLAEFLDKYIISFKKEKAHNKSYYFFAPLNKAPLGIKNYFKEIKFKIKEPDSIKNIEGKEVRVSEILKSEDYAKFSSRIMISDIICIYKTLKTLRTNTNYGSFSNFLKTAIHAQEKPLYELARMFYELTYCNLKMDIDSSKDIVNILRDININEDVNDFEDKIYNSKRLWCVTRDFVYHPIFKECFKTIIGEHNFEACQNDVESLELPGDVRNNNPTFAKCFWLGDKNIGKEETPANLSKSSKFVRTIYQNFKDWQNYNKSCNNEPKYKGLECYPKDFDITFSFVPNMCSANKCGNCPINKDSKFSNLDKFCHGNNGKLCTFVLYTTGIEHECSGIKDCKLRKIMETN